MHFFIFAIFFYSCNICVTFSPFLLQESFVNVFSKCILPKIASLLLFVDYYKCFLQFFIFVAILFL